MWVTPKRGTMVVPEVHERRSRVALTVAWMATTLAIALFVPDIGKVIELIGGISAFFIFIFPGKSERWEGGERAHRCQGHCCGEGVGCSGPGPVLGVQGDVCGGCRNGAWVKGAMVARLSFCHGDRAVPGVHDRDPHPRATQKVSVCGSAGKDRGRVRHPMTHGPGRVTLAKVAAPRGEGFGAPVGAESRRTCCGTWG